MTLARRTFQVGDPFVLQAPPVLSGQSVSHTALAEPGPHTPLAYSAWGLNSGRDAFPTQSLSCYSIDTRRSSVVRQALALARETSSASVCSSVSGRAAAPASQGTGLRTERRLCTESPSQEKSQEPKPCAVVTVLRTHRAPRRGQGKRSRLFSAGERRPVESLH